MQPQLSELAATRKNVQIIENVRNVCLNAVTEAKCWDHQVFD